MKQVSISLLLFTLLLPGYVRGDAGAKQGMSADASRGAGVLPAVRSFTPGLLQAGSPSGNELYFRENKGQVSDQSGNPRPDIGFKLETPGLNIFIGSGHLHYQWSKARTAPQASLRADKDQGRTTVDMYRMDVILRGASPDARVVTEASQDGSSGGVLKKIVYQEVYPSIDWVLYIRDAEDGSGPQFEYDFVVRPGGRVSDIRIAYEGAAGLRLNRDGSLTATTPAGVITEQAPVSFDEAGHKVSSQFVLDGDQMLGFRTAPYRGTLVIDPVIKWGTYYGQSSSLTTENIEDGHSVVCDRSGNVYMVGQTNTTADIATTGAHQTVYTGYRNAFLVKFDCSGKVIWGTYYGGGATNFTFGIGVACDADENVYMTGYTNSPDSIGTTGSHQASLAGDYDAFLVKFNKDGVRQWGTYYGGTAGEYGDAVACDAAGNVYIGGSSFSTAGIATRASHQEVNAGGGPDRGDGFLAKFNRDGVLQWGTYYGGTADDWVTGITCYGTGSVYITGGTNSETGIATPGSHRDVLTGVGGGKPPGMLMDGFLVKLDSNGTRQWSTYYGGDGNDVSESIATDRWGNIYLTGYAYSTSGLTTPGVYQTTHAGQEDAFLTKFNPDGDHLWSTYYGDGAADFGYAVACDLKGDVYVFGQTTTPSATVPSTVMATPGSHQTQHGGLIDAFVAKFDSSGTSRIWATYYGGSGFENLSSGIGTSDGWGNIYFTGITGSMNAIATPGSHKTTGGLPGNYSGADAFLVRFHDSCALTAPPVAVLGDDTVCPRSVRIYEVPAVCDFDKYTWTLPQGWTGSSTTNRIELTAGAASGDAVIRVAAINRCGDTGLAQNLTVNIRAFYPLSISADSNILSVDNSQHYVSWQWYYSGQAIQGATDSVYMVDSNGIYSVKVTDINGCTDSAAYGVNNISVRALSNADGIRIYPNPVRDRVYITAPVAVKVAIAGMDGKIIYSLPDNPGEIDITGLPSGLYMLRIEDGSGRLMKVEKLVKTDL